MIQAKSVVCTQISKVMFYLSLLVLCMTSARSPLGAQSVNDVALRGLRTVHQNSFINPSWIPDTNLMGEYRASTGFHLGGDLRSNYLVINDIFRSLNENNDIRILKLLTPDLSTFNYTGITATAGLGFTTMRPLARGGFYLTLGYQIRTQMAVNLNGSEIVTSKNSTVIDMNKTVARGMAWGDLSVGISGTYKRFDYGVRLKYLMGLAYANLDVDAKGIIKEDSVNVNINKLVFSRGYIGENQYTRIAPAGNGVAIDLGLTFRLTKNTTLDFSLLDVGFIGWNQNSPSKVINNQNIRINYLVEDSYNPTNITDRYLDANPTLRNFKINIKDSLITSSILPLYSQLSLGFKHNFNANWQVGAIYHHINAPAAFQYAVSVHGSYRFLRHWEVTLNTGLREGGVNALGMGLAYTSPKFQAFITTENLMMFPFTYDTKNFHFLLGVNFRIGKQSIKLISPVDRILCADPIVDESIDEATIMGRRKGLLQGFGTQKKGLKYADENELREITSYGNDNKFTRKYNNSYSEIFNEAGEEGGDFNEVKYIGEKLSERELPEYNPKPAEIEDHDKENSSEGRVGGFYSEKYEVPLPKRKKSKPQEKDQSQKRIGLIFGNKGKANRTKEETLDVNYGEKGGANENRQRDIKMPKNNKAPKQRNLDVNYGERGGGAGNERQKKIKTPKTNTKVPKQKNNGLGFGAKGAGKFKKK